MTDTKPKTRPIVLRDWEVRAILDGRKTQTRRPVKPQPERERVLERQGPRTWDEITPARAMSPFCPGGRVRQLHRSHHCPFGVPGDRLWVRETWAQHEASENKRYPVGVGHEWGSPIYRATFSGGLDPVCEGFSRWRPSIHMPRWASRIDLEVTDVRVERLQEITCGDVEAEGMPENLARDFCEQYWFRDGWDAMHAKRGYSWATNPWVWVVEFRRAER